MLAMKQQDALAQFGHFDDARREFVLTNWRPPKPWKNILFNARFNIQPTQAGAGICYRRDEDGTIILINWSGHQGIYIVDLESGQYFCLGNHTGKLAAPGQFESRFGLGYQVIRQQNLALEATLTITVPVEGDAALYRLEVRDLSGRARKLRLVMFSDIDLNVRDPYHGTRNRFRCNISGDRRVIDIHNQSHLATRLWQAYLVSSRPYDALTFERENFEGAYGTVALPQNIAGRWSEATTPPDRPCLVGATELTLPANGSTDWRLALGCTKDTAELPDGALAWVASGRFEAELERVNKHLEQRYQSLEVQTPDEDFDRFVNIWLQHQLAYNAYWNRGWGNGVRDGMQDAWAYLLVEPGYVRKMIEAALPHQFADGRTVRKWAPIDAKPYNDGGVWLTLAVWAYISETGDVDFLSHRSPYFQSDEEGSVLDHIFRAMKYLAENRGAHGLCLMPYGDWNDQLTGPGKGGKGESVWTTMAMAAALPRVAELSELAGEKDIAGQCRQWRAECEEALQKHGWNGQWFNRAFDDDGRPVGHPDNTEGRIYLLPQAWAVIAQIATQEQREKCLSAAREHLLVEHGYLLLTPAYTRFDESVGQLSATDPGTVENGGNYCHASSFMMNALCQAGRVDDALDLFGRLVPTNPNNPPARSRQEPFSVTNCYRGPAAGESAGRGHFSWRTGTAGWMVRTAVEGIMGIRATLAGLEISGRLPTQWDKAQVKRKYRGRLVTIQFNRTGRQMLAIDGRRIEGNTIPADQIRDGSVVTVEM